RSGGQIDVHAVLHRLGFRDGQDVDADGDGVGIGEAHRLNVGHAGFLAGNTPAERLRPEPADRGVIPSIHSDLNKPQRHATNPKPWRFVRLLREICDARPALPGWFARVRVIAVAAGSERGAVPDRWNADGDGSSMWMDMAVDPRFAAWTAPEGERGD